MIFTLLIMIKYGKTSIIAKKQGVASDPGDKRNCKLSKKHGFQTLGSWVQSNVLLYTHPLVHVVQTTHAEQYIFIVCKTSSVVLTLAAYILPIEK